MRLKALKVCHHQGMSPGLPVQLSLLQTCSGGVWLARGVCCDVQRVHLCPPVLKQQNGLYHGPIWKLGQPEHLPLQGTPCWVCGPVQTRQTCIKPCCSVSSMFLPLSPSTAALGFPHHLWAADVYSMAVEQKQNSFPPSSGNWDVKMFPVITKIPHLHLECNDALGLVLSS